MSARRVMSAPSSPSLVFLFLAYLYLAFRSRDVLYRYLGTRQTDHNRRNVRLRSLVRRVAAAEPLAGRELKVWASWWLMWTW